MRSVEAGRDPGLAGDRRVLLADVAAQQVTARGQAPGDADRREPGERADLDGLAGADEAGQQRQQRALVGADLHAGGPAELGRAGLQLQQHLVGGARALGDVGGDRRGRTLSRSGHSHPATVPWPDGRGDGGTTLYDAVGGDAVLRAARRRVLRRRGRRRGAAAAVPGGARHDGRPRAPAAVPVQYWGGPTTYSDERGHPRLRMRHMPFHIGGRSATAGSST